MAAFLERAQRNPLGRRDSVLRIFSRQNFFPNFFTDTREGYKNYLRPRPFFARGGREAARWSGAETVALRAPRQQREV